MSLIIDVFVWTELNQIIEVRRRLVMHFVAKWHLIISGLAAQGHQLLLSALQHRCAQSHRYMLSDRFHSQLVNSLIQCRNDSSVSPESHSKTHSIKYMSESE